MISTRNDEVADQPLISINDEVTAELFRFFVSLDKLKRRQVAQITTHRLMVYISTEPA